MMETSRRVAATLVICALALLAGCATGSSPASDQGTAGTAQDIQAGRPSSGGANYGGYQLARG